MIHLLEAIDERQDWFRCTSRWSILEVARALKNDGKPKELIQLNLSELKGDPTRSHRFRIRDNAETKPSTVDLAGSGARYSTPKEMERFLDRLRQEDA